MAYTLDFSIALGAGNTGLTLTAQLVDTAGVNVGAAIATGFVEFGSTGNYLWHTAALPDSHRGGVLFKSGATVKAFAAINPQEAENTDVKTSSITAASIAAAVWSYVTRTLTQSAAQVIAVVSGTDVTLRRGETIAASFTGLGSLVGRSKLWFTVKHLDSDLDTAAILQIVETTGLVYLNGAAGTAGNGSLVVTDATTGALTVNLAAVSSATLVPDLVCTYDIQVLIGTTVTTLTYGRFTVRADQTRATS